MQTPSPNLPPHAQRETLRRMLATRRFEESASADCLAGKICGGRAIVTSTSQLSAAARAACQ